MKQGLKDRVKRGEITPDEAYDILIDNAKNSDEAAQSKTAKWLLSSTSDVRYKKGVKAAKRSARIKELATRQTLNDGYEDS